MAGMIRTGDRQRLRRTRRADRDPARMRPTAETAEGPARVGGPPRLSVAIKVAPSDDTR